MFSQYVPDAAVVVRTEASRESSNFQDVLQDIADGRTTTFDRGIALPEPAFKSRLSTLNRSLRRTRRHIALVELTNLSEAFLIEPLPDKQAVSTQPLLRLIYD